MALATRWWRAPDERSAWLPHLLLWAFTLACLARIPLKAGAFHYGFYLLPAPLVACGVLWFDYLPRFLATTPAARRVFACTAASVFIMFSFTHYRASKTLYDQHTLLLDTPRGRLCCVNTM